MAFRPHKSMSLGNAFRGHTFPFLSSMYGPRTHKLGTNLSSPFVCSMLLSLCLVYIVPVSLGSFFNVFPRRQDRSPCDLLVRSEYCSCIWSSSMDGEFGRGKMVMLRIPSASGDTLSKSCRTSLMLAQDGGKELLLAESTCLHGYISCSKGSESLFQVL